MDNYVVKIYARAYRDLDGIYTYIVENLMEPETALNMIDELEKAIFGLEQFPERGAVRCVGAYAGGDYRQLFVKNYANSHLPALAGTQIKMYEKIGIYDFFTLLSIVCIKAKKRCISSQYVIRRVTSKTE